MTQTRRDTLKTLGAVAVAASVPALAARAQGTVHEVQMLNVDPDDRKNRQVFIPDIVRAQPGDTIRFISVDRGHNSKSNDDMIPDDGTEWDGKIGDDVEVVIETEGAYGHYCTPHQTAGMVGLIVVGDVSGNYEAIKEARQRGRAKQRYEDIFSRADAMLAEEGGA